jgi:hypothetical protein
MSVNTEKNTVIFIDAYVADAQTLVAGAQAEAEVYVLHPAKDAIEQMTQRLQHYPTIASVHLVCHGSPGHLMLAGKRLGQEQLADYAEQLAQWQAPLQPQGQVLLYACHVAAGEEGRSFVQRLSQLMGVPVAAADGLVGNAALGGTWQLTYRTGTENAPLPFPASVVREYAHTLIDLTQGYSFLWREGVSGSISGWQMAGTQFQSAFATNLPKRTAASGWQLAAGNDFGGSGDRDLFLVNERTGENQFWQLNSGNQLQGQPVGSGVASIGPNSGWKVGGSGDFDQDGETDIFWYNEVTGETTFWKMNGFTYQSSMMGLNIGRSSPWKAGGVGDFDQDNNLDIFWYNEATGATTIWKMAGFTFQNAIAVSGAPNIGSFGGWQAKGAGDYNGDGNTDVFWYNSLTGTTGFWLMNKTAYQQASTTGLPVVPNPQNWDLAQTDWNFTGPNITPPTASLNAPLPIIGEDPNYDFTVTYSDDVAVNVSSLDSNDIRITGPNGFNQLATFVSSSSPDNGTPRTATYRFTAPGGSWDSADNGNYSIALEPNQVSDTAGNTAAARTLGQLSVSISASSTNFDLTRGLVGYWQFDGTGGSVVDSSGNGNNGVFINSNRGPGRYRQALELSGANDSHVSIPATPSLDNFTNQVTVTAWVFPDVAPEGFKVVASRQVQELLHPDQFYLGFGPQGGQMHYKWHLGTDNNGALVEGDIYTGTPASNRWIHMAGVYDGSIMRLYIDGVEIGSQPLTGRILVDDNPVTIGGEENGSESRVVDGEFDGRIDEVRLYNRALSAAEIQAIYQHTPA